MPLPPFYIPAYAAHPSHRPASMHFIKICPRYLEYCSHADTACSPVQRICTGWCQKNCIHSKCRRRTENCSDICWIYHIFQNCNTPCILAELLHRRQCGTVHGTEHAACQLITCDFCKYFNFCHINRDYMLILPINQRLLCKISAL